MNSKLPKICCSVFFILLIWGCSTQKKIEENHDNAVIMNKKGLPVGSVDLSCEIIEIFEIGDKSYCTAKVTKIHEYGNSVKALAEGSEYEFEIDINLLNNIDQSSILDKDIRCRLIKLPGGLERNAPDKLKIVNIMNQ